MADQPPYFHLLSRDQQIMHLRIDDRRPVHVSLRERRRILWIARMWWNSNRVAQGCACTLSALRDTFLLTSWEVLWVIGRSTWGGPAE